MTTAGVAPFAARLDRVRARMAELGVGSLGLSVGPDLPWLSGYEAMPLERLTMLVIPADGEATLVVPGLEASRVTERPDLFSIRPWSETEDPIEIVAGLVGTSPTLALGDRTWARFVIDLDRRLPAVELRRAVDVVGPLRAVKDDHEIAALRRAAAAVDRIVGELQAGRIPLVGRTEAEVSADLGRRIVDEGHQRVNFAIVAAGANAASPHHEADGTVITEGDVVLCDFGGTMHDEFGVGYCSDITRCVWTGEPTSHAREVYDVLFAAQAAGVAAGVVGATCESVDTASRAVIADAGYGEWFIHRTGHGIGVEEHEDPYMVSGNLETLVAGHAYSVEPGIYLPGELGFRLEDIVVATAAGPEPLNRVDHHLAAV